VKKVKKTVSQFYRQSPFFYFIQRDFMGMEKSLVEMLFDTGGKGGIIHAEVLLEIQSQAAGIQVGRADQGPDVIHKQEFGVYKGGRLVKDPDTGGQQFRQQRLARPLHKREIVQPRQHDTHLDAAQGGGDQGRDHGAIRDEIGGHDTDRTARAGEGAHDDLFQLAEFLVGTVAYAAYQGTPLVFYGREEERVIQPFSGHEEPVFEKRALKVCDHRPLYREMDV
jgi:hypothetical protein